MSVCLFVCFFHSFLASNSAAACVRDGRKLAASERANADDAGSALLINEIDNLISSAALRDAHCACADLPARTATARGHRGERSN